MTTKPTKKEKLRPYVHKASAALKHYEATATKIEAAQTQQALELAGAALWAAEAFTELLVRVKNANIRAEDVPDEINFATLKQLTAARSALYKFKR